MNIQKCSQTIIIILLYGEVNTTKLFSFCSTSNLNIWQFHNYLNNNIQKYTVCFSPFNMYNYSLKTPV